ncbi:hypothetical protein H5410_001672 [Solanum commersonii]|uniref:Uncharacterized protein n=1 Tax=Solanum commersonii TaxID=4109 RepID=A0A9J6B099_SOLCO|nr:hypothetical protein H5410_001672 [Solanum commersonii]
MLKKTFYQCPSIEALEQMHRVCQVYERSCDKEKVVSFEDDGSCGIVVLLLQDLQCEKKEDHGENGELKISAITSEWRVGEKSEN